MRVPEEGIEEGVVEVPGVAGERPGMQLGQTVLQAARELAVVLVVVEVDTVLQVGVFVLGVKSAVVMPVGMPVEMNPTRLCRVSHSVA